MEQTIKMGITHMTLVQPIVAMWNEIQELTNLKLEFVNYQNNAFNRKEIIDHLGQGIDIIPSVYDESFLERHQIAAFYLAELPLIILAPGRHPLLYKDQVEISDLGKDRVLMLRKGHNEAMDRLRYDLISNYPGITINDFSLFNMDIFQKCDHSGDLLIAYDYMEHTYPLLKRVAINWHYSSPYGLLTAKEPDERVQRVLDILKAHDFKTAAI